MIKKNKALVVGAGSIGKRQIDNFKKYFLIDVVDVRKDRLKEVKDNFKINNTFTDYKKALYKKNLYDIVFITVPPHLHLDVAKRAVKFNSGIFIEKPLGMDVNGWFKVYKECKKKKLINYVAYCHRFVSYTNRLKKLLEKKIIGNIYCSHLKWSSYLPDWHPYENYKNFYMSKKHQGGGSLLDDSHGLDLIRYVLGEVKSVKSFVCNISELQMTSDDSYFSILKMKNNTVAQVSFDLFSRTPRIYLEITGSKGTIIWDRVEHKIKIFNKKNNSWKIEKYTKKNFLDMYPKQADYFYKCFKYKKKNFNNIKDALETQKIIDASFKASSKIKFLNV